MTNNAVVYAICLVAAILYCHFWEDYDGAARMHIPDRAAEFYQTVNTVMNSYLS